MKRPPRPKDSPLLDRFTTFYIIRIGLYITLTTLVIFWWADFEADPVRASTFAFSTLVISQLFNSFNIRHRLKSILNEEIIKNKILFFVVLGSIILQLLLVHGDQILSSFTGYTGNQIGDAFNTVPLQLGDWIIIILVAFSTILVEEIYKFFGRKTDIDTVTPKITIDVEKSQN